MYQLRGRLTTFEVMVQIPVLHSHVPAHIDGGDGLFRPPMPRMAPPVQHGLRPTGRLSLHFANGDSRHKSREKSAKYIVKTCTHSLLGLLPQETRRTFPLPVSLVRPKRLAPGPDLATSHVSAVPQISRCGSFRLETPRCRVRGRHLGHSAPVRCCDCVMLVYLWTAPEGGGGLFAVLRLGDGLQCDESRVSPLSIRTLSIWRRCSIILEHEV